MMTPRLSDELEEKISVQVEGLLEGTAVDAMDLSFERQLEIVFEATSATVETATDDQLVQARVGEGGEDKSSEFKNDGRRVVPHPTQLAEYVTDGRLFGRLTPRPAVR